MFKSIEGIIQANTKLGHHFFEHIFLTAVADPRVFAGKYFITRDFLKLGDFGTPDKYTIRIAADDGSIGTVGGYSQYETLEQAIEVVQTLE